MISALFSRSRAIKTFHSFREIDREIERERRRRERKRNKRGCACRRIGKGPEERAWFDARFHSFSLQRSRADATVIRRTRHAAPAKGPERPCIVSEERDRSDRSVIPATPSCPSLLVSAVQRPASERTRSREEESRGRPGEVVKKPAYRTKCEVSTSISLQEHFLLRVAGLRGTGAGGLFRTLRTGSDYRVGISPPWRGSTARQRGLEREIHGCVIVVGADEII